MSQVILFFCQSSYIHFMSILNKHTGLYTDHYELTMAQGYFLNGRKDTPACFDYFFRKCPFNGSYVVFAGLYDVLNLLENLHFEAEDLDYLKSIGFQDTFLDYLRNFRFSATIYGLREGEVIFPNEPVMRVEGNIIETQIIETLVLNLLNFESLIATKASRIRQAAGENRAFIDFGLRRAQGFGGIHASRAAVIGGADSTSNVYSAYRFELASTGTQAHSWIQSYDDELTAFRDFAQIYPEKCIMLVDTYDTLKSGIPNAIIVAKEMAERGQKLFGVRLDSGDLSYLSKKARQMLDDEGLNDVKIVASNQLDEYLIRSLLQQNAPIDAFGVGTKLIVGKEDAALDGVYKLVMSDGHPRLKVSENIEKIILPGIKKVYRLLDDNGQFYADAVMLDEEQSVGRIYHPHQSSKNVDVRNFKIEKLYQKVMENGKINIEKQAPEDIRHYVRKRLRQLPEEHKRFENPHVYKVGISERLMELRDQLLQKMKAINVNTVNH